MDDSISGSKTDASKSETNKFAVYFLYESQQLIGYENNFKFSHYLNSFSYLSH